MRTRAVDFVACAVAVCALAAPRSGDAQAANTASAQAANAAASTPAAPRAAPTPAVQATVNIGAYIEAFYAFNFNQPSIGLTHLRGFDNRHNSFTISNAVLDGQFGYGPVSVRLALQVGHTPETYYLAEPASPGAAGAGATGASVWKYLQQAYGSVRIPVGGGLQIDAGIMLSPIGVEALAVRDSWNWSRSNLFFGLPFYHTGIHAAYSVNSRTTLHVMACNGWNSVVDNNDGKSVEAQFQYAIPDRLNLSVLYFAGIERPNGAAEGAPWRHLLDANATIQIAPVFAVQLHVNGGVEPLASEAAWWLAGALGARVRPTPWLYASIRGDFFAERPGRVQSGLRSTPIFWGGAGLVGSATATLDVRPVSNMSVRLEYRHDQADTNAFFRGVVPADPLVPGAFVTNAASQDTLLLGLTTWVP